jgi:hypothetical protein
LLWMQRDKHNRLLVGFFQFFLLKEQLRAQVCEHCPGSPEHLRSGGCR